MIFAAAALALQLSRPSVVAAANCENPNEDVKVVTPAEPKLSKSEIKTSGKRAAVVSVSIASNGSVQQVKIAQSSGDATVDKAAMDAAKASTYAQATRNCAPVPGKYLFRVQVSP